ncbi:hypothetical protein D3C81_1925650 [compost metagenome]
MLNQCKRTGHQFPVLILLGRDGWQVCYATNRKRARRATVWFAKQVEYFFGTGVVERTDMCGVEGKFTNFFGDDPIQTRI